MPPKGGQNQSGAAGEQDVGTLTDAIAANQAIAGLFKFKCLYFWLYAAFGVLSPYLSVFFDSRGFTKPMIGILQCIPNVSCMLVGPYVSSRADASNTHFEVMVGSILLGAATTLSMLYVGDSTLFMTLAVVMGSIIRAPLTSIFDSVVISSLPDPAYFGKMRLWGAVSFGMLSLAGGLMLGSKEKVGDVTVLIATSEFSYIFYANASFCALSALLVLRIRHERAKAGPPAVASAKERAILYDKLPMASRHENEGLGGEQVVAVAGGSKAAEAAPSTSPSSQGTEKDSVFALVRAKFYQERVGVSCFAFVVFASGISDGVIEAFLFVRLAELGGSGALMGMGRFITCAAEVIVFQHAGKLYNHYGVWKCLACTSLAFLVRFCCYMLLDCEHVWWVLPVESLNGLTFAMTWQTSCQYAAQIAPPGCEATMQSLLESLHWGLGSGAGAVIAGFIYREYGAEVVFGFSALLSALSLVIAAFSAAFLELPADKDVGTSVSPQPAGEDQGHGQGHGDAMENAVKNPVFTILSSEADDDMEEGREDFMGRDVEIIRL